MLSTISRGLRVNKPDCTTDHKEKSMIKKIFYMELEYQNYNKYKQESGHWYRTRWVLLKILKRQWIFRKKTRTPSFLSTSYVVVTEEGKCLFVDKVVPENTGHPTQQTVSCLKQFSFPCFANIWRVINTDSLYLAKKYVYNLSLDIIWSSKLTVFHEFGSRRTYNFQQIDNIRAYFRTKRDLVFIQLSVSKRDK